MSTFIETMNLSFSVIVILSAVLGGVFSSGGDTCISFRSGVTFYGNAAERIVDIMSVSKLQGYSAQCKDTYVGSKIQQHLREYSATRPSDCGELDKNVCPTGIYTIYPDKSAGFDVLCDMEKDGGGWTVFQRRLNGLVNFYRDWEAYKRGFGSLNGEFWLGNEHIYKITNQEIYTLRIDLTDFKNNHKYAKYSKFSVGPESNWYTLEVSGYSGDAGNDLGYHNDKKFTTKDKDNDLYSTNCANDFKGGWWYGSCHSSNLNGLYLKGNHSSYANGVNWKTWTNYNYSLKATTMMIKRAKLF